MATIKNLVKRSNIFYVRVAIPKELLELRAAAGSESRARERMVSLKTGTYREAVKRRDIQLALIQAEFDREISERRAAGTVPLIEATDEHLAHLREQFRFEELTALHQQQAQRASRADKDALKAKLVAAIEARPPKDSLSLILMPEHAAWSLAEKQRELDKEKREILDRELRDHLNDQQFVLVSDYIENAARNMGVRIDPASQGYRALGRDLIKQWRKVLDRARREDDGEIVADPPEQPRMPSPAAKVVSLEHARGKTSITPPIDILFDTYLREKKGHVKPTDRQNLQATLRQFVECVGRKAVTAYDVDDMAAFKRALLQYPRDAGKRYPGLPLKKAIEQGRRDKQPVLAANTVRGKLSSLSAFGKWLESNVAGVRADSFSTSLPALGEQEQMEPFDLSAVKQILNSRAFIGCLSKQNQRLPGEYRVRGWQFWLVMISAFTGARLNEITQLAVSDVRTEKGVLVFDFRALGENQRLKTTGSTRLVPVHPKLIELGLERVVDAARSAGHADLFHEVSVGRDARRSEKAGRWFDKFLKGLGLKDSRGRTHRWRHTVTDALRRADVNQYDIAASLGHVIDIARMTNGYGREMDLSLPKRLEFISKIDYPGVDWTLLH